MQTQKYILGSIAGSKFTKLAQQECGEYVYIIRDVNPDFLKLVQTPIIRNTPRVYLR
jgi:hypothetical protein